jgi:hypothetical protein
MVSIDMGGHYDAEYPTASRKAFQIRFDVLLKSIGISTIDQHRE